MRNHERCTNCGSFELKDAQNNSFFCSKKCYLEYHFKQPKLTEVNKKKTWDDDKGIIRK